MTSVVFSNFSGVRKTGLRLGLRCDVFKNVARSARLSVTICYNRRDRTGRCCNDCFDRWRLVSCDRIPTITEPFFAVIRLHHMYHMETSLSFYFNNFLQFPAIWQSAGRAVYLALHTLKRKCVKILSLKLFCTITKRGRQRAKEILFE